MKEKIYYEYGYKINYLIYRRDHIDFEYNNHIYSIYKTNLSNEKLERINFIVNYLDNYAIFFHQIIPNKSGFSFEFGSENYVLLKLRIISERQISIDEIIRLSNISINIDSRTSIEEKIDFLELYLSNYDNLELENINYFLGLAENSITLFNLVGPIKKNYVGHKRIEFGEKAVDFYNPLNIVLDYKTRDLAEYTKSAFIHENNLIIKNLELLNRNDWVTYFARILFPSYYFDILDSCVQFKRTMDKKRIRYLANSFEKVIRELYVSIANNIYIPNIEWLSNINNF